VGGDGTGKRSIHAIDAVSPLIYAIFCKILPMFFLYSTHSPLSIFHPMHLCSPPPPIFSPLCVPVPISNSFLPRFLLCPFSRLSSSPFALFNASSPLLFPLLFNSLSVSSSPCSHFTFPISLFPFLFYSIPLFSFPILQLSFPYSLPYFTFPFSFFPLRIPISPFPSIFPFLLYSLPSFHLSLSPSFLFPLLFSYLISPSPHLSLSPSPRLPVPISPFPSSNFPFLFYSLPHFAFSIHPLSSFLFYLIPHFTFLILSLSFLFPFSFSFLSPISPFPSFPFPLFSHILLSYYFPLLLPFSHLPRLSSLFSSVAFLLLLYGYISPPSISFFLSCSWWLQPFPGREDGWFVGGNTRNLVVPIN
jgi:hypothetical protein